jgi:uncharacterized protein YndB with AHSA1/START domain
MLKLILVGLVAVLAIFLIVVAMRPSDFRITRSATIAAPPAVVFEQINNLQKWNAWSPWARLDPNATNTFDGPAAGVGASMAWAGNHEVGEGHMTITESQPEQRILMDLEFVKPFEARNLTEFAFSPQGEDRTVVTWSMSGRNNFIGKAASLIFNCEKMVGGQFEQGFTNLKAIVENTPAAHLVVPSET